jgi:hypothetical protein
MFISIGNILEEYESSEMQFVCKEHTEAINPLNAELNPICHLMALLGAHHIFHVSRIRVNPVFTLSLCIPTKVGFWTMLCCWAIHVIVTLC